MLFALKENVDTSFAFYWYAYRLLWHEEKIENWKKADEKYL